MGIWISALEVALNNNLPTDKNGMLLPKDALAWLNARAREGRLFKIAELEWSGLVEWLELQEGKVSKQSLVAFVKDNGVQVTEVLLGKPDNTELMQEFSDAGYRFDKDMDGEYHLVNVEGESVDPEDLPRKLLLAWDSLTGEGEAINSTMYSKYTVPGGDNYKELLLTLPVPSVPNIELTPLTSLPEGYETIFDRMVSADKQWGVLPPNQMYARHFAGSFGSEDEAIREALVNINALRLDTANWEARRNIEKSIFKSSHYQDTQNILVHVRFDERVDAEGKRVLFISEIQSDWGQQGKKEGFERKRKFQTISDNDYNNFVKQMKQLAAKSVVDISQGAIAVVAAEAMVDSYPMDRLAEMAKLEVEWKETEARRLEDYEFERQGVFVPQAPFVTKTDAWVGLALKRMIHYAAENDFDKVAIISGQQAVDLYDLSKQLSSVRYNLNKNGLYGVVALGKPFNGATHGGIVFEKTVNADGLPEIVGKDLAAKIIAGEGVPNKTELNNGDVIDTKSFSGLDLKVGGEGMTYFYDKLVPKVANDVLKKLGGKKVELIKLEDQISPVQVGFSITPELRSNIVAGVPLFSLGAEPVTELPSFKNWFGDSKVVDGDGKPLVVYHGSGDSFNRFNPYNNGRGAIYFTPEPSFANDFAKDMAELNNSVGNYTESYEASGALIYPVYLSVKNPFDPRNPKHVDLLLNKLEVKGDDYEAVSSKLVSGLYEALEKYYEDIQQLDFDGFYEKESELSNFWNIGVFNPEQIKSAVGNNRAFNPGNASILHSLNSTELVGLGVDVINAEIKRLQAHWVKMPPVTVVNSAADLPFISPTHADGAFIDGHVYIVAKNISSVKHLQKVMAHECVMHYSLQEMLGEYGFAKLSHGIQKLKANGDPVMAELANNIKRRYGQLDTAQEASEIVALAGERCLDDNGNVKIGFGFMKSVYAGVAGWLRDAGIKVPFNNLELQGIMYGAGQWIQQDLNREVRLSVGMNLKPAFKLGDLATSLDTFKKWFGDSKVVGQDGMPLVVYHGTRGKNVSTFMVPDTGTYFTTNLEAAESYGEVISSYLNISNPLELDFEGESDMGDVWNIEEEVAYAKENGFDGLIVRNSFDGENELDQFVVFEPNQIKAAVGNNLDFSPMNPNILYSLNEANFPREGSFSGKILKIEENVITQKINRAGDTVKHNMGLDMSKLLEENTVVNIQYKNGKPVILDRSKGMILR